MSAPLDEETVPLGARPRHAVLAGSTKRAQLASWVLPGIVATVGLAHYVNLTFDDAFISFRYAENLARGEGLVFNPGERVEGYSNFLWTVLLTLPIWLGVDRFELGLLVLAKVIGSALSLATLVLLARTAVLGRAADDSSPPWVAPLYLATLAPFLVWGMGALETPLVGWLLLLTVHLHLQEDLAFQRGEREIPWSYGTLALAALTRPEPVLLILPLAGLRLERRLLRSGGARGIPKELARLALFALPYCAFLLWRWSYYGELVPNTYYAKVSGDPRVAYRGWYYLEAALADLRWLGPALLGGLAILLARRVSYRVLLLTILVGAYFAIVMYEGGDWMPAYRMLAPVLPLCALLVDDAWRATRALSVRHFAPPTSLPAWVAPPSWLAAWRKLVASIPTPSGPSRRWLRRLVQAPLLAALAGSALSSHASVRVQGFVSGFRELRLDGFEHFAIARWINRSVSEPGLLAIGEAGVVPYYTKLPVLDLFGLMDRHIARRPGRMHLKFDADYVFSRQPKYLLLLARRTTSGRLHSDHFHAQRLLGDPRLTERYRARRTFETAVLFERIDEPALDAGQSKQPAVSDAE